MKTSSLLTGMVPNVAIADGEETMPLHAHSKPRILVRVSQTLVYYISFLSF